MLYVVGLGLGDEKDITVNGLEAVKKCERVYLEAYTSRRYTWRSTGGAQASASIEALGFDRRI